jgi:putative ABC transport system substrate-binding protein
MRPTIAASLAALALAALASTVLAQTPVKAARVGVLSPGTPAATAHLTEALSQGLRASGYVENQNLLLDRRYAEGKVERLAMLADELVAGQVDVIVTATNAGIQAARNSSRRIPIVMANSTDPVDSGFVASLAHPGGNITGLTYDSRDVVGKRLELLREILPKLARIEVLMTPTDHGNASELMEIQNIARALAMQVRPLSVTHAGDLDAALSAITKDGSAAIVVVGPNPVLFVNRKRIVEFAARSRVPTMSTTHEFVHDGGLISYGPNNADLWRRAAAYVAKILKGAKPADLPVEQPTKFELVVNLKTAKALGITIPPSILARADEVIE